MQATARKLSFYLSIDYDFLDDPKVLALTGWAFKTLMYLMRYKDGKQLNGWTIPIAQATLAEKVGCTDKSLRKHLTELEKAGFLMSKDTKKRVYRVETQPREILPRPSVKNTDVNNISLKDIKTPPKSPPIAQPEQSNGEGEKEFNKIKAALVNKGGSSIPSNEQIRKIVDQIYAITETPIDALIYAIRKVDVPRIASLPKLFSAARKKEAPFWELIKEHRGVTEAKAKSQREKQRTQELIAQIKGGSKAKETTGPTVVQMPNTPWSREDAVKMDTENAPS